MSSPRSASEFDGVLRTQDVIVGPIKLPLYAPDDFVLEFNAMYGRIGLKIDSIADLLVQHSSVSESAVPR